MARQKSLQNRRRAAPRLESALRLLRAGYDRIEIDRGSTCKGCKPFHIDARGLDPCPRRHETVHRREMQPWK